eukprot:gene7979-5539_t
MGCTSSSDALDGLYSNSSTESSFQIKEGPLYHHSQLTHPSPLRVCQLLRNGELCEIVRNISHRPPLHQFILTGKVECVKTCIDSGSACLAAQDYSTPEKLTALQCVLLVEEQSKRNEILRYIFTPDTTRYSVPVMRTSSVSLAAKNAAGHDFLSFAAQRGLLATAWRNICDLELTKDLASGDGLIHLTCGVQPDDWRQLNAADKARFYPPDIAAPPPTPSSDDPPPPSFIRPASTGEHNGTAVARDFPPFPDVPSHISRNDDSDHSAGPLDSHADSPFDRLRRKPPPSVTGLRLLVEQEKAERKQRHEAKRREQREELKQRQMNNEMEDNNPVDRLRRKPPPSVTGLRLLVEKEKAERKQRHEAKRREQREEEAHATPEPAVLTVEAIRAMKAAQTEERHAATGNGAGGGRSPRATIFDLCRSVLTWATDYEAHRQGFLDQHSVECAMRVAWQELPSRLDTLSFVMLEHCMNNINKKTKRAHSTKNEVFRCQGLYRLINLRLHMQRTLLSMDGVSLYEEIAKSFPLFKGTRNETVYSPFLTVYLSEGQRRSVIIR